MNKGLAIVTGAGGGMGSVLTTALAKDGYEVIMACINAKLAQPVYTRILKETQGQVHLHEVDLSDYDAITRFTDEVKQSSAPLKILLNNAGVLCPRPKTNANGIEYTVAVNYLAPVVITGQLLPLMGKGSRVAGMISLSYKKGSIRPDFFLPKTHKDFNRFACYANSKLALYYYMTDAAEKWKDKGIAFYCADPGIVDTGIIHLGIKVIDSLCNLLYRPLINTPAQGAASMLHAATSPDLEGVSGIIIKNKKPHKPARKVEKNTDQRELLRTMTGKVLKDLDIKL